MQRALFIVLGVVFIGGLVFAGQYVYQNYRGIGAALLPPPPGSVGQNPDNLPITLQSGFSISVYAKDLDRPRVLMLDPAGKLLVSLTAAGKIVAVSDQDGNGKAETNQVILEGLNRPHGMATRCTESGCKLYVAQADKITVYDYVKDSGNLVNKTGTKLIDLPFRTSDRHFTRSLLFRPFPNDKELLVSIGSTCDVCHEADERHGGVIAVNVETKASRIFATGLRNAVFMTLNPVDGKVWATEMGRDMLGDNLPPDEINVINDKGNYGWPICYGKNIHDTDFDKNTYIRNPCMEPFETPSVIDLQAHSAPLGLSFIPEEGWPHDYWYNLIVAYHGSWNRSTPTGYKLARIKLDAEGKYLGTEDFATGWLGNASGAEGAIGRPADVLVQPGGTMYVSDDKAGVVYRITYTPPDSSGTAEELKDLIRVSSPAQHVVAKSPLVVRGEARGTWFFEASFPVKLFDKNNQVVATGVAQAEGEWMTQNFVRFKANLTWSTAVAGPGTLVLYKDNPSGLPENERSLRIPVEIEASSAGGKGDGPGGSPLAGCRITGCSSQICSDKDVVTTCEYRDEYSCYRGTTCERQSNGECGWTVTEALRLCLKNPTR